MQLCTACERHIKALPCPFCDGASARPTTTAPPERTGLSRAQVLAGVVLAGAVAACSNNSQPIQSEGTLYGAPPDHQPDLQPTPPPRADAGTAEVAPEKRQKPTEAPAQPMAPAYGGPPPAR